jgi:hypothetical protein
MTAVERLDDLLGRYDADLRFEAASECAWSGQVRLTLTNPANAPSRSITFFSVGGVGPEDVAEALLKDVEQWLRESGQEPLPVPD